MHKLFSLAGLLAATLLALCSAQAQYPNRPIRFIVPFPPGGTADVAARLIAAPLGQTLGQSIVIDNRPGADGAIAGEVTMKAHPDGYTIFWGTNSAMSAVPALRKKPPYDPNTNFTPISSLGRFVFFLYVHPSVPARTVKELVDYSRANSSKVNYGTGNTASIVASAQLKMLTGLDVAHIPYKGDAPATADLVGGRVQFAFMSTVPGYGQARDGKLRIIATLMGERSALAPDAPTMAEAGFPGVSVFAWAGMFGPPNMPKDIVQRLSREVNTILTRPEMGDQLGRQGFVVRGSSPDELAVLVKTQLDAWKKAVREAGIPLE
jgi:tripartite-type tricarboxylate transporter receptor subunit TctC